MKAWFGTRSEVIFALDIPELTGPGAFPGQFVNALLGPQCPSHAGQAMLTSFVRFVEASRAQYRGGRSAAQTFVRENQNLYGFIDASTAFETCNGYMHRAIRCMRAIRSKADVAVAARALFPQRPPFMENAVQNSVRNVRDAVQHSYDRVFSGSVPTGTPFMLALAGTEVPTPTVDNPQQTTMTWDRIEIGIHWVSFADMALWLNQTRLSP